MSVWDTQARLATPGQEVIVPADAGQLACLVAIDDADGIIQDEIVLKSGVTEAASLSFDRGMRPPTRWRRWRGKFVWRWRGNFP